MISADAPHAGWQEGGALSVTPIVFMDPQWVPAWTVALSYPPTPSRDRGDEEK